MSENKSSTQQLPTPNFECLVAKHVMFAPIITTCFFLTCTHLDATDGNMVANATNIFSLATKNSGLVTTLATRFLFDLDLK